MIIAIMHPIGPKVFMDLSLKVALVLWNSLLINLSYICVHESFIAETFSYTVLKFWRHHWKWAYSSYLDDGVIVLLAQRHNSIKDDCARFWYLLFDFFVYQGKWETEPVPRGTPSLRFPSFTLLLSILSLDYELHSSVLPSHLSIVEPSLFAHRC